MISLLAEIDQASGRAREALEYWGRLEKAGIMYEEALRYESKAYEALGSPRNAVRKDALRFDMFDNKFTDEDLSVSAFFIL